MDLETSFWEETFYSEGVGRREAFECIPALSVYENIPLREEFY